MSVIQKDAIIAPRDMIEDKSYFTESLKWYNDTFVSPAVSRISYIIFFVICSATILLSIVFILKMFPLHSERWIVIKVNRDPDTYIKVRHLRDYSDPVSNIVIRAVENYVLQRESYIIGRERVIDVVRQKIDFVKNSSSNPVFDEFQEQSRALGSKLNNMIAKNEEVRVMIKRSTFINSDKSWLENIYDHFVPVDPPSMAQVDFTVVSDDYVETRWRAIVEYDFKLFPQDIHRRNAIIPFKVIKYSLRKLIK